MHVDIFTDGSARGNPDGPGGYGTILRYVDPQGLVHEKELSQGYVKTTNNRMELMAVIVGLRQLNRPCEVTIYSDSKYVIDAFNQHWVDNWQAKGFKKADGKPVKNPDLWKVLIAEVAKHEISFVWVKGHDGHLENERCDTLATTAADSDNLIEDVLLV